MKLVFDDIRLRPGMDDSAVADELAKTYYIEKPATWRIVLKSLDARHKNRIVYRYRVVAEVPDDAAEALLKRKGVSMWREEPAAVSPKRCGAGRRVIVVGAGPAGLFCALRLSRAGVGVLLLERGFEVEKRMAHIGRLKAEGLLNPESNVLFGEGGAGAYSDGKLTTRTRRPEIAWVFATLTECGAPERILYEQKPHLGTDGLAPVVRALRDTLLSLGADVRFNTRVDDLIISGGAVRGVITAAGDAHEADAVVLAAGHSARDTGEMLLRRGVFMEKKPFAMGVRVEHPAALIDEIQYGPIAREKLLPAADYRLVHNNGKTGRAVYSFCVCPGGGGHQFFFRGRGPVRQRHELFEAGRRVYQRGAGGDGFAVRLPRGAPGGSGFSACAGGTGLRCRGRRFFGSRPAGHIVCAGRGRPVAARGFVPPGGVSRRSGGGASRLDRRRDQGGPKKF
ncbi:MAG TPA: FAD-dependent oxidoreductase [Spirochaetes bacterium]|nr:FAD-dependent oxidoreductase [Spirochaetota bacterium]